MTQTAKYVLGIVGLLLVIMGLMAFLFVGMFDVYDPVWHAGLKILVGLVVLYFALKEK